MGRQRLNMREDDGKATTGYARERMGSLLSSWPRGVTAEAVRQWAFAECSKGCVYVYMHPLFLAYHALYSAGYDNCIQNRPHDCRRPAKAQGSKEKPAS
jgi:hypothetical protein